MKIREKLKETQPDYYKKLMRHNSYRRETGGVIRQVKT